MDSIQLILFYFRYDLDQSTFSPPTNDDSFFYIRYPKTDSGPKHLENDGHGSIYKSINEVLEHHTLPCQEFIPAAKSTPRELGMKLGPIDPPLGVVKSAGTDDGFHSVSAACGHSVVAVAHQMIAGGKLLPRQASSPSLDDDDLPATPPPSHMLARRRGSKSLPSSPQTSPKLLRKNPYFTNVLLGSTDNIAKGRETRQSWLLSYMRDTKSLRGSMSDLKISEETPQSLAEAAQQLATTAAPPTPTVVKPKQKVAKPKPSQLREMNFWSPTSM
ncbi:uncharacterized protein LOC124353054 [Homalodisca vitripennis]|uniref:uncharacterized protein LOC124353054 n=1 Tax=Homalodisca vitripennis TaxID=197043 RepID=UPI001EEAB5FF|nr:uncharacterized protein LOC124353054 [Homalodisca vitripennis]